MNQLSLRAEIGITLCENCVRGVFQTSRKLRTVREINVRSDDQFQSVISLLFDRWGQGTGVVRRVQGIHWFSMILRVLNRTIIDDQLGDNYTVFGTKIGLHDRLSHAGRMTPECLVQAHF